MGLKITGIKTIFKDHLYSVQYEGFGESEFTRLFKLWKNPENVDLFIDTYKDLMKSPFWVEQGISALDARLTSMNKNISKVDFLNKISAGQDTEWLKEAMWRRENAAWLKKSMDIANDVLDELHKQKMSKSDFARAMGVSPQRVTTLLSGREKMNLETISKMEEALHITLVRTRSDAEEVASEEHRLAASFMFPLVHYATESLRSVDNIYVNSKRGKVELNCI